MRRETAVGDRDDENWLNDQSSPAPARSTGAARRQALSQPRPRPRQRPATPASPQRLRPAQQRPGPRQPSPQRPRPAAPTPARTPAPAHRSDEDAEDAGDDWLAAGRWLLKSIWEWLKADEQTWLYLLGAVLVICLVGWLLYQHFQRQPPSSQPSVNVGIRAVATPLPTNTPASVATDTAAAATATVTPAPTATSAPPAATPIPPNEVDLFISCDSSADGQCDFDQGVQIVPASGVPCTLQAAVQARAGMNTPTVACQFTSTDVPNYLGASVPCSTDGHGSCSGEVAGIAGRPRYYSETAEE